MKPLIVVAGVSGAGKSTIGPLLAVRLGVPFTDGDALHPASNLARMAAGEALTDVDRAPWLELVGRALADAMDSGLVMACSALRRPYRRLLLDTAPGTRFVMLVAPRDLLAERLATRQGHFMPADLLDSQLEILEPLGADEPGITVEVEREATPEDVAARIMQATRSP